MKKIKKKALISAVFFVAAALVYYSLLLYFVRPESVQRSLTQKLESITGGTVSYSKFQVRIFPVLTSDIRDLSLKLKNPAFHTLKSERIRFRFRFLPTLIGRFEIAKVETHDGMFIFLPPGDIVDRVELSHVHLKLDSRGSSQMRIEFDSDLQGQKDAITGKGTLGYMRAESWSWNGASFDGNFHLHDLALKQADEATRKFFMTVKNGMCTGDLHLHKDARNNFLYASTKSSLSKFLYTARHEGNLFTSPEIDANLEFELGWDPIHEEILLKRSLLSSPAGKIEISGKHFLGTRELRDFRLTASGILLEAIPQYYLPLKEAIPFNFGFSGRSDLEMSMEGTLDHLSIHANWDLSQALLAYAGYFSKPKDVPANVVSDFLLKDGRVLTGDFSVRMQEATIKGSLTNMDMQTGEGQLNLITNKFQLSAWQPLLPPLLDYKVRGDIKVLANLNGNFLQKPGEVKKMLNLTLEEGEIADKTGNQIKNIEIVLDYGQVALQIKKAEFEINGSQIGIQLAVFNPGSQQVTKVRIVSPRVEPSAFFSGLESFGRPWMREGNMKQVHEIKTDLEEFFPPGQFVDKFHAEAEIRGKQWNIPDFSFEAYGGTAKAAGVLMVDSNLKSYALDTEFDRINLARYFRRKPDTQAAVDGNLFFQAHIEDAQFDPALWQKKMTGKGAFSITNGEFHSFSLMSSVAKINGLAGLSALTSGGTKFSDVHSEFVIKDSKFSTAKLTLLSDDLYVMGDGDLAFDGSLNYRLDTYIDMPSAGKFLKAILKDNIQEKDQKLGPVPLLLSGKIEHPELEPNPALLPQLQENLAKNKSQKLFRNFLPEDLLSEPPKSS